MVALLQLDRKQQAAIIVMAAVIVFTAGYRIARWQGDHYRGPARAESVVQAGQGEGGREIVVHVSGAVEKPGVYKFNREARITDALEKAAPLERADVQGLNLAAPLKDGQKIVVPLKQDAVPAGTNSHQAGGTAAHGLSNSVRGGPAVSQAAVSQGGGVPLKAGGASTPRVNINRASARELEALPGLGPGLAQRIVNYRESKGLFVSEEDIKSVPGIGEKMYEQLKDYIIVN